VVSVSAGTFFSTLCARREVATFSREPSAASFMALSQGFAQHPSDRAAAKVPRMAIVTRKPRKSPRDNGAPQQGFHAGPRRSAPRFRSAATVITWAIQLRG
jgi:hypothetical protein